MPLPRARDPREAGPARHPPAAEGRGVSGGRTARRDAPLGSTGRGCGRPFSPSPSRGPPARPAAPGRMRRTTRQSGDGGRGGRAPGRRTRPRAAIADPRPRARPPAPAPHLISGRVRARGRPSHKSVQPARREEERRVRSRAHHPRPPARPLARLLPAVPEPARGCSLASRRTTEQPSCAPSPRRSSLLALLRSFAPSLPPISSSPSAAFPAPPAQPRPRPQAAIRPAHRWAGTTACQSGVGDHASSPPLHMTTPIGWARNGKSQGKKRCTEWQPDQPIKWFRERFLFFFLLPCLFPRRRN